MRSWCITSRPSAPSSRKEDPYTRTPFRCAAPDKRPKALPVQAGYYCIDTGTPLYRNAYIAARDAADTALTAADEILGGRRLAYAALRPPGHHAGRRFFGGFCYFNNAAIAAQYLAPHARVAIIDIDFHHGNGQQDIFYNRDDVLTVSIHGDPNYAYPYFSGYENETGESAGLGYNRNFILKPNAGEEEYMKALKRALGIIRKFDPEILIVALGFDTLKGDPTGTLALAPSSPAKGRARTRPRRLVHPRRSGRRLQPPKHPPRRTRVLPRRRRSPKQGHGIMRPQPLGPTAFLELNGDREMEIRGKIQNGKIVMDNDVQLPEGARVRVVVIETEAAETTLGQRLMRFSGVIDNLPSDLAENHDHYLYGRPKK